MLNTQTIAEAANKKQALMKFKIVVAPLFTATSGYTPVQQVQRLDGRVISVTEINRVVTRLMDTANVHGLSLAILNHHKTVFRKFYGYKNRAASELLDTNTVMYGVFFSKAVFSYLTLKLVQEKALSLDQPLYKYLSKPLLDWKH